MNANAEPEIDWQDRYMLNIARQHVDNAVATLNRVAANMNNEQLVGQFSAISSDLTGVRTQLDSLIKNLNGTDSMSRRSEAA